ncbi:F-box protein CPR1-like isoform X2 [Euphorbia lathyris]|uniref:F-box protein CPR1-like isoform X2 n=1 Tax=Euphorbia lathyris TaxID=212925 RepID=UPI00331417A6
MAQLYQDLIIEILLWLPVKSVLRYRCLSKSLHAVIDSPKFINWHLKDIIWLENPVSSSLKEVFGYCNGLVLLNRSVSQRKFGFDLWNPSTRQYREVPGYPFKVTPKVRIIGSGLGYDVSSDDYKALFMVCVERKGQLEVQVWICRLKSTIWKRAQNLPYLAYKIDSDQGSPGIGYFSDGSVHWLCTLFCSNRWKSEIVGFDVQKETFSLVSQPVCSIDSVKGVETKLHVLEGCLCISYVCSSWNNGVNQADLYMRKKDGVDQYTWTKLFSVMEPLFFYTWFDNLKVLGYSKRGDKILLDLGMDYMLSYDLEEKRFRKVEIDQSSNWDSPILGLLVESLVLCL